MTTGIGANSVSAKNWVVAMLQAYLPQVLRSLEAKHGVTLPDPARYRRRAFFDRGMQSPEIQVFLAGGDYVNGSGDALGEERPEIDMRVRVFLSGKSMAAATEADLADGLELYAWAVQHVLTSYFDADIDADVTSAKDEAGIWNVRPSSYAMSEPATDPDQPRSKTAWVQMVEVQVAIGQRQTSVPQSLLAQQAADGPITLYTFGDIATATSVRDHGSRATNGALAGTYTLGVTGLADAATAITLTNAEVDPSDAGTTYAQPHQGTAFAIEALVRASSLAADRTVLSSVNATSDKGCRLWVSAAGVLNFEAYDGASGVVIDLHSASDAIVIDTWYHVVITHNGTTATMWIDGVQVDSDAEASPTTGASTYALVIGRNPDESLPFVGRLQSVAWYVAELTAARIAVHMAAIPTLRTSDESDFARVWLKTAYDATAGGALRAVGDEQRVSGSGRLYRYTATGWELIGSTDGTALTVAGIGTWSDPGDSIATGVRVNDSADSDAPYEWDSAAWVQLGAGGDIGDANAWEPATAATAQDPNEADGDYRIPVDTASIPMVLKRAAGTYSRYAPTIWHELGEGVSGARILELIDDGDIICHEGLAYLSLVGSDMVATLAPGQRVTLSVDFTSQLAESCVVDMGATEVESAIGVTDDWAWGTGIVTDAGALSLATRLITRGGAALGLDKWAGGVSRVDSIIPTRQRTQEAVDVITANADTSARAGLAWFFRHGVEWGARGVSGVGAATAVTNSPMLGARQRAFIQIENRVGSTVPILTTTISHWRVAVR